MKIGIFILSILLAIPAGAASWLRATNASRASLDAVLTLAVDGDVIYVPDDGAWHTNTTQLDITKAVFIISESAKMADGIPSGTTPTWKMSSTADMPVRFSGFMLKNGGRGTEGNNGNLVIDRGSGFNLKTNNWFRIDNNHLDHLFGNPIQILDAFGVIDHNTGLLLTGSQFIYGRANHYGGGNYSSCCGHGSWTDPVDYSSDRFIFSETNILTGDSGTWWSSDGSSGMRLWQRYNTMTGGKPTMELGHGTDSGGERRGTRISIANNNTMIASASAGNTMDMRSGEAIVYDNVISNYTAPKFSISIHRLHGMFTNFYWGANGTNANDVNYTNTLSPGNPFATGVTATVGTRTMTVSGAPWVSGQWTNYTIQRKSAGGATDFGYIIASTTNSVTWAAGFTTDMSMAVGDAWHIWRVLYAMDMPGRTGGGLWTNSPSTRPSGWNDQVNTLSYEWNNANAIGGSPVHFGTGVDDFLSIEGLHWTNAVKSWTPYQYPHALRVVMESIGIVPGGGTVAPLATVDFEMIGGNGTNLVYQIWPPNNSGGSINATTGLYTAGVTNGVVDTIRAWDTWGDYADAQVMVDSSVVTLPGGVPANRPKLPF